MLKLYKNVTHQLTILFVLLSAFSINLPTRFMDISLSLLVIFWVISGDFKNKIQRIKENPGALVALGFFVLIGLSIFYTSAPIDQALSGWLRYHGLLFIPIIVSTLDKKNDRNLAFNLFLISSVFVIIISYLKWIKIVPLDFGQDASISNFVVFKFRIAHSVFMAFASFIFLSKFLESKKTVRYLWLVIAIAIIFNIIFLVDSRTGQIAILAALVFFGVTYKNTKILKYILFLLLSIFLLGKFTNINPLGMRILTIHQEIVDSKNQQVVTSAGERAELWTNTMTLIKSHPILGGGVGSLRTEYAKIPDEKKPILTKDGSSLKDGNNPHNQFLLTTQEIGLFGMIYLIFFWHTHWLIASKLNKFEEGLALKGLLIIFVVSSAFNCMLWAGEGKFFYVLAGIFLSSYKHRTNKKIFKWS